MLPLCSSTLTSRLVPLLRGQPRCARDNGMNVGMINPRGCWEKTQECVNQGDNTLFSRASVGGAGIMVLQTGFADLQPPSAGWDVYTGRCHGCQGAPKEYSHICLAQRSSLVLSIASRRETISWWTGNLKSPYQSLQHPKDAPIPEEMALYSRL